jgi:predicted kinase
MSTDKKEGYHKPSSLMWTRVANQMLWGGKSGSGKKKQGDDDDDDDDDDEFDVDLENSFYVGDSVGGEDDPQGGVDVTFAKNVGAYYYNKRKKKNKEADDDAYATTPLKFYTPTEFFGPSHQALRSKQAEAVAYETPSTAVLETRAALTGGYLHGPILLMLCGAQGSGKSTFCQHLLQEENDTDGDGDDENIKISHHWVHLSQDTIRNGKAGKREHVEEAAKQALGAGKSVVIDRMHLDESQREHFVKVAQQSCNGGGVPVHVVVLTPPKDLLAQRVQNRENHAVSLVGSVDRHG